MELNPVLCHMSVSSRVGASLLRLLRSLHDFILERGLV